MNADRAKQPNTVFMGSRLRGNDNEGYSSVDSVPIVPVESANALKSNSWIS
jgi:hypothetical protein